MEIGIQRFVQHTVHISFYGGEPLLNFNFIEQLISYIENNLKNSNRLFAYSMTTNAILLPKYIEDLVNKNFKLLISLDGDEQASSYRVYHDGKPVFKQVYDAVKSAKERYPDFFETNVSFNAVLHNRNSIEGIVDFFKANFGKTPNIGEINTTGIRPNKTDEFKTLFKNRQESLLSSDNCAEVEKKLNLESPSYNSAFTYLLMNSPFFYMDYNELLFGKKEDRKELPSGTCLPFQKKVFITAGGKIFPCERIGHDYFLGTLTDNDEVDIDFDRIADTCNGYYERISGMCFKCYDKDSCLCCMFQIGVLDNTSPVCKNYMTRNDYEQYLKSQYAFFTRHPELYAEIMNNAEYV
jgi:uncharacterized protein